MKRTGSFVIGSLFSMSISLILLGLIMIFSSSQFLLVYGIDNNVYANVGRQLIWFSFGLGCLAFFSAMDFNRWERYSRSLMLLTLFLLVLVLSPLGVERNGARRWLYFGPIGGQPSDLAKLTIIFYLSAVWADREDRLHSFIKGVLFPMLVVGLALFLIILEPDNGTTFFIGVTAFVIWFVAGGRLLHLVPATIAMCSLILYAIYTKPHLFDRIKAYLNPEQYKSSDYYQVWQSLIGFAYGGVWGAGLGEGQQQLGFTPFPHTDFIFSTMGEELGFVNCSLVVLVFLGIILLGYYIAIKCTNPFGRLLAVGCTTAIGVQAALNISVVTGSIPTTGISLPFISYGGSSLLISMSMIGLLISIAKETFISEARVEPRRKRRRRKTEPEEVEA